MKIRFVDNDLSFDDLSDLKLYETLKNYDSDAVTFLQQWLNNTDYIEVSTSGSTGTPKNIQLSKKPMILSAQATINHFNLKPQSSILLCLPSKFIAGKMIWVRAIVGSLDLVISKPSANPIKDLNKPISFAAMTPHQVSEVLSETPEKLDLIETLIIGGAPVSDELLAQLQGIQTHCYATYGMTETITHVAIKKLNGGKSNSYYKAVSPTTFTLGTESNLIIHCPHLFSAPITTNDIVNLIDDTTFEWLGRLDFVINSGGVKLFPERIEAKLSKLLTEPFFISKISHPTFGEVPVLVVQKNSKISLDNLKNILDKIEMPKDIIYVDKILSTANGKIDRKKSLG